VALRNINIIVQRYPDLLANEVKVRTIATCQQCTDTHLHAAHLLVSCSL
jgi:hypothetical protein